MKHISIIVTGEVQGVFFRASAKEIAEQLNIKGFAQNRPDGSVYLEAEGEAENLKRFVDWCSIGPPRSHVSGVTVQEGELKKYEQFVIKR